MLSGDNQRTASAIAKKAGIDEGHGDFVAGSKNRARGRRCSRPKLQHVETIGDGVNDAPAMAAASVGIAMGGAGTDTAIETADMALMQDDLSKVAEAIALGRRTIRIIQFNIAFALALKAIFLVLALPARPRCASGLQFSPIPAQRSFVIANALRLLRTPSPI